MVEGHLAMLQVGGFLDGDSNVTLGMRRNTPLKHLRANFTCLEPPVYTPYYPKGKVLSIVSVFYGRILFSEEATMW